MRISAVEKLKLVISILDRLLSAPVSPAQPKGKIIPPAPAYLDAVDYTTQTLAAFRRKIESAQPSRTSTWRSLPRRRPTDTECDRSVAQLRAALQALQHSLTHEAAPQSTDITSPPHGADMEPLAGAELLAQAS
ncbi:hypothetical protein ACLE20_07685 [Rhizobium sp. YIM 134829]|uniref:hypothetical protein n=1 Tax=Rhizobium sp. YIM 134829 TaxID=3390453 RepID=UPI00397D9537